MAASITVKALDARLANGNAVAGEPTGPVSEVRRDGAVVKAKEHAG